MFIINCGFCLRIITYAGTDISVQNSICKAQVILITLAAKSIRRSLVNQIHRQTKFTADSLNLGNRKTAKRSKIAGSIAVTGRVAHPILGKVTGP